MKHKILSVLFYLMFAVTLAVIADFGAQLVFAQTNSLTIGGFTLDATGSPTVTVKPPTRAGTLAITADIPPVNPPSAGIAGTINVSGTAAFTGLSAAPICSVTPRYTVTATGITLTGVDYLCLPKTQ